MARCFYCNKIIKPGRGKIYVASDGGARPFCSGKCEKNFKLGRNPKKVNWIRKVKKKDRTANK